MTEPASATLDRMIAAMPSGVQHEISDSGNGSEIEVELRGLQTGVLLRITLGLSIAWVEIRNSYDWHQDMIELNRTGPELLALVRSADALMDVSASYRWWLIPVRQRTRWIETNRGMHLCWGGLRSNTTARRRRMPGYLERRVPLTPTIGPQGYF